MSSISLEGINTLTRLADRNSLAKMKIAEFATAHGIGDAIIGGTGAIIPGMGPVALSAAIALQVPVYQKLVMELGRIYCLPPTGSRRSASSKGRRAVQSPCWPLNLAWNS